MLGGQASDVDGVLISPGTVRSWCIRLPASGSEGPTPGKDYIITTINELGIGAAAGAQPEPGGAVLPTSTRRVAQGPRRARA